MYFDYCFMTIFLNLKRELVISTYKMCNDPAEDPDRRPGGRSGGTVKNNRLYDLRVMIKDIIFTC